jgi:hypothetical protein
LIPLTNITTSQFRNRRFVVEEWKPVVGYESLYEVSNMGRVKALDYRCRGVVRIVEPRLHPRGYLQINLRNPDPGTGPKQTTHLVHCLVAEAFLGPRPEGQEICHSLDPTKTNNNLDNLRYDTPTANMADDRSKGGRHSVNLSDQDRIDIHELYRRGWASESQIYHHYNIGRSTFRGITSAPTQINRLLEQYPDAITSWVAPDWINHIKQRSSGYRLSADQRREIVSRYQEGRVSIGHLAREYKVGLKAVVGLIRRAGAIA